MNSLKTWVSFAVAAVIVASMTVHADPLPHLRGSCAVVDLGSVSQVLASGKTDACYVWVHALFGRVVQVRSEFGLPKGSGAILRVNAEDSAAVVITARHVSAEASPTENEDAPGSIGLPESVARPMAMSLSTPKTAAARDERNLTFTVFADPVPAQEAAHRFAGIRPAHDFAVGIMTAEEVATDLDAGTDRFSLGTALIDFFDPKKLTKTSPAFAEAKVDETVIVLGHWSADDIHYTVGKIATPARAREVLAQVPAAIPFDDRVEFLVEGRSEGGMSGAGVFDAQGRMVGHLVRGSRVGNTYYYRAVKTSYVMGAWRKELDKQPAGIRSSVTKLIGAE